MKGLDRTSPAARILSALIFALPVSVLPNLTSASAALAAALLLAAWTRPEPKHFLKRALQINIFVLFLWLFTPWTTPGEPVYGWITREGLFLCALVTIKANALFIVFYVLVSSLSFSELSEGLQKLRFSDRLVAIVLFCARGINLFETELTHMREAAKLRGFQMKTDRRTYQTVAAMISLLFARSFRKSRVLNEAMLLRGFDGKVRMLSRQKSGTADWALITVFLAAAILIGVYGWKI